MQRSYSLARNTVVAQLTLRKPWRAGAPILGARGAMSIALQLAVLWLLDIGTTAFAAWAHLPIPGNVLGLVVLLALLCTGIVKAVWLERAATLLVRHLAFFFVPITVGLIGMGRLFELHGAGIFLTLAISAAAGMAACGLTSERMLGAPERESQHRPASETER